MKINKIFVQLKTGLQFEITEKEYERLLRNANPNENICFIQEIKTGERKICVPVRNIDYFYALIDKEKENTNYSDVNSARREAS